MKRILFEERNESIWIKIEIYQTPDGKIMVHGHDSGKTVSDIKQRYDYEYYLTIEKEHIPNLLGKVALKDINALMDWFVKEFSNHRAVSQIKEKLNELDVNYQFSTW